MPTGPHVVADDPDARSRWTAITEEAGRIPAVGHPGPLGNHEPDSWLLDQRPDSPAVERDLQPATTSNVATVESDPPIATDETERSTSSWLLEGAPAPSVARRSGPTGFVAGKRQAAAVDMYCAALCQASASAASAEVLESFSGGEPEELLRHMRVVAAKHTPVGEDRPRGWRRVLSGERERVCASTPSLLAARANDELTDSERAELEQHLSSCLWCQALELRALRAERAFAGVFGTATAAAGTLAGTELGDADATAVLAPAPEAEPEPVPENRTEPVPETEPEPVSETPPEAAEAADPTAWLPVEAGVAAGAGAATGEGPSLDADEEPRPVPTDPHTRRRRLAGVLGAAAAVVAAITVAAIVLTGGSTKTHRVASGPVAAAHAVPAASTPVRHHAVKRAARRRRRAAAVHHPSQAKAPAVVAAAPAATAPASPAPAQPAVSQPAASAPVASSPSSSSGSSNSRPSSPAPSQPAVSFQQSSLGAANASQGIGSK